MSTAMLAEALQAPEMVAQQLAQDADQYAAFGALLRSRNPSAVLTVARGSSDHAAQFLAYLVMARMGRLVTSLPMSLITLYQSPMRCQGMLSLAFSQSGQSPDLVAPTEFFSQGGAITAAFVNETDSPLARAAQWAFALHAGQERSVASSSEGFWVDFNAGDKGALLRRGPPFSRPRPPRPRHPPPPPKLPRSAARRLRSSQVVDGTDEPASGHGGFDKSASGHEVWEWMERRC